MSICIDTTFSSSSSIVIYEGSCFDLLKDIPDNAFKLIVTSPPYNIGKEYEKKTDINHYYKQQELIIDECVRVLDNKGSICWQVGNYVNNSQITPLDIFLFPIFQKHNLKLRNRIIWHFEHGLHCTKRFSGRYETLLWFTKGDSFTFNLDNVRIPQKYPNKKYFKGPKTGDISCNPLGKNPGDVWDIPNVKNNHVEKTIHPCQFPIELVERLVLSLTNENDWVFDPFLGVGSSIIAAIKNNRRGIGAEIVNEYVQVARERVILYSKGFLKVRPRTRPIYDPNTPSLHQKGRTEDFFTIDQLPLFEKEYPYKYVK